MTYGIIDVVERPRVLFLCVHNSARSQIAEGLLRSMAGDGVVVRSAGLEAGRLRPEAVAVMSELGLDISGQRSKSVNDLAGEHFDVVVTTCDEAKEACPLLPGAFETLHWGIADPASVEGDEETRLDAFREARDDLWAHVADLSRDLERTQLASSRKR